MRQDKHLPPLAIILALALLMSLALAPAWAGEPQKSSQGGLTSEKIDEKRARLSRELGQVNLELGQEYLKQGNFDAAITSFKKAISYEPDVAEAHLLLGWAYATTGIAKRIFVPKGAPKGTPMPSLFSRPLLPSYKSRGFGGEGGFHIRDMERVDAAVSSLKEAIRLKPELADAHSALGRVYKIKEEWDAGIASYKEAVRLRPNDADLRYELATLFHIKGRPDEAVDLYKEALGIERKHMAAHIALFEVYSETTQYDAALNLIDGMKIYILLSERDVPEGYKKQSESTQGLLVKTDSEIMEVELQEKLIGELKKEPYLTDSQVEWLIRIEDLFERAKESYRIARTSLILYDNMPDAERKIEFRSFMKSKREASKLYDKATRDLKTLIIRVQVRKKRLTPKETSS